MHFIYLYNTGHRREYISSIAQTYDNSTVSTSSFYDFTFQIYLTHSLYAVDVPSDREQRLVGCSVVAMVGVNWQITKLDAEKVPEKVHEPTPSTLVYRSREPADLKPRIRIKARRKSSLKMV